MMMRLGVYIVIVGMAKDKNWHINQLTASITVTNRVAENILKNFPKTEARYRNTHGSVTEVFIGHGLSLIMVVEYSYVL